MGNFDLQQWLEEFDGFFAAACEKVPQKNSFDITGTEESCWKFLINEKGVVTIETQYTPPEIPPDHYQGVRRTLMTLFDPEKAGYGSFKAAVSHKCLEGFLPVSVVQYRTSRFAEVEQRVLTDEKGDAQISVTAGNECRYYRSAAPDTQDPAAVWQMSDPPVELMADGRNFEEACERIRKYWQAKLAPVLNWEFPHSYLKNGILSALVKSFITRCKGGIRYGATRYYCDTERTAESFPPTIITMVESCLFYGLHDEALKILGYYIDNFVSSGELLHRGNGASVSEHGMMLETFCNCCMVTGDRSFQEKYSAAADEIALRLLRLIRTAGKDEIIKGCPEDDLRMIPYKQWFSSNLWAAKGLLVYGTFRKELLDPAEIRSFADKVVTLCCGAAQSVAGGGVFIPPCLEALEPFEDMNDFIALIPEDDIHSLGSYTNYRFYPEMLSSGLLPDHIVRKIMDYRKMHGGDFYGTTTFRIFRDFPLYSKERCLDDWPVFNILRGLAHCGEFREVARILAGHMAIHQSRGSYFAPEMSFRDYLDSTHCVPSQLTLPLAVRYLFARSTSIKV